MCDIRERYHLHLYLDYLLTESLLRQHSNRNSRIGRLGGQVIN